MTRRESITVERLRDTEGHDPAAQKPGGDVVVAAAAGMIMLEDEGEWVFAINALICRLRPDPKLKKILERGEEPPPGFSEHHMILDSDAKPLADMLRGGKPIPPGIRDTLAELLDPTPGNIFGVQIFVKETKKTIKQFADKRPVAIAFKKKLKDGMTVEIASEETGEEFGVCDRTVRRDNEKIEAATLFLKNRKP